MMIYQTYESAEDAKGALSNLRKAGFSAGLIQADPQTGTSVEADEIARRGVARAQAQDIAARVKRGETVVIVNALFGTAGKAHAILGEANLTAPDAPQWLTQAESDAHDDAAPLSSLLNMPVLSNNPEPLSSLCGLPTLTRSRPHKTSSFGLPLLSNKAAPLSSLLGVPQLSENPAPLSSATGAKTLLSEAAPLSSKTGMKTLSSNAAPLSSMIGMKTLSQNPTPLSSLLGLKVLTEREEPILY